jgi:hypothetical protein
MTNKELKRAARSKSYYAKKLRKAVIYLYGTPIGKKPLIAAVGILKVLSLGTRHRRASPSESTRQPEENMPFLEEINERRAEDRRKNDRRKGEATVVPLSSFYEQPTALPVRKPANISQSFGPRISSQVSNREIEKQMNEFLDRLMAKFPEPKVEPKPLSDEQVVAALATEATLMFANSKPCWLTEEVKAKGVGAGE